MTWKTVAFLALAPALVVALGVMTSPLPAQPGVPLGQFPQELSRRDEIALRVLPALIQRDQPPQGESHRAVATRLSVLAVVYADALVEELDRKPKVAATPVVAPEPVSVDARPTPVYRKLGDLSESEWRAYAGITDSPALVLPLPSGGNFTSKPVKCGIDD